MAADQVPMLVEEDVGDEVESSRIRFSKIRVGAVLASVALVGSALAVASGAGDSLHFRGAFERKDAEVRTCRSINGVQFAEPESKTPLWKKCSAKWSVDCSDTGCCADYGMKCFRKNKDWATCKASCKPKDEKNESWTCDVVAPPTPRTPEGCFADCQQKSTCKQAVFTSDGGGDCRSSDQRLTSVVWASDSVNSTYCGSAAAEAEMKTNMDKVIKQLPFQIELPLVNCSWGGDDCSKTKCCNDYICDKNFESCNGFSCYKKNEYFSGCAASPLDGWDGEWQGGPREHRIIAPAGSQVAVQGTSLYCFTVVTWTAPRPKPFWNSEEELANNWKSNGIHVMQCDGHEIVDGIETPKAEWGSFSNIDLFMDIWQKIKGIGAWKNYDWTVKVDSDAVFIPSRLKDHLYNLRTPRGSRVYLENVDFKFKFMGAIEIMSREAVAVFVELGHTCIRGKHEGGEDSFLKTCLDGLGIDHQEDFSILHDKYAGLNPPCTDGWAVAYHYLKKSHDWSECYNQAVCGSGEENACDKAIAVPHEPGWGGVA